jgi:hypothetical protein
VQKVMFLVLTVYPGPSMLPLEVARNLSVSMLPCVKLDSQTLH